MPTPSTQRTLASKRRNCQTIFCSRPKRAWLNDELYQSRPRFFTARAEMGSIAKGIRHHPRSGWLDGWDRLKGGRWRRTLETVLLVWGFLLSNVLFHTPQLKSDRGNRIAPRLKVFAVEIRCQPPQCLAIAMALLPLRNPTTEATANFGGISIHMCT